MDQELMNETYPLEQAMRHHPFCSAVIVAGGRGTRMDSKINKVYIDICGKKAIVRTLEAFEKSLYIDELILVVCEKDLKYCTDEIINKANFSKLKSVVAGGARRQDSVYNGLKEVSEIAEIVLVHDGARPLVSVDTIEKSISAAVEFGAVSTGMPVKDTIKIIDSQGFVCETPARNTLWAVQTPQAFRKEIILEAHKKSFESGFEATDDAMLVEKLGHKIKLIEGSYENIKLTTPEDIAMAEAIIREREKFDTGGNYEGWFRI